MTSKENLPVIQASFFCTNDLLTGLLGPYWEIRSPIFLVRPEPRVKVRLRISSTDRVTQLVNRLLDGIIIFETKTTFLQDQHNVWYVVLMFTNRLYDLKVSENKTG